MNLTLIYVCLLSIIEKLVDPLLIIGLMKASFEMEFENDLIGKLVLIKIIIS